LLGIIDLVGVEIQELLGKKWSESNKVR
jgi:hypothetical protein